MKKLNKTISHQLLWIAEDDLSTASAKCLGQAVTFNQHQCAANVVNRNQCIQSQRTEEVSISLLPEEEQQLLPMPRQLCCLCR